jgi:hypothetical protein
VLSFFWVIVKILIWNVYKDGLEVVNFRRCEIMQLGKKVIFLIFLSIILATVIELNFPQVKTQLTPYDLVVNGLVDRPINFTYSELQKFPMVSEVTPIECVSGWTQLYNWTGIPLFFLLSMTGVNANATKVVFYARDNFSTSLTIEKSLHPATLIALQANGTLLSDSNGYPYRLVAPCKYGYKWAKWVTRIEVVNYDYKGTYESLGYSDKADISGCTLPSTTPPFETFHVVLGSKNYSITLFSNSTIDYFEFDGLQKQISLNLSGAAKTTGYCYVTIPKEILFCDTQEQWQIRANDKLIEDRIVMENTNYAYIYFDYNHSVQVRIKGIYSCMQKVGDFGSGPPLTFFKSDGAVDAWDFALWKACYDGAAPSEAIYLADLGSGPPPTFFICDGAVDTWDFALWKVCYDGLGPDP